MKKYALVPKAANNEEIERNLFKAPHEESDSIILGTWSTLEEAVVGSDQVWSGGKYGSLDPNTYEIRVITIRVTEL